MKEYNQSIQQKHLHMEQAKTQYIKMKKLDMTL